MIDSVRALRGQRVPRRAHVAQQAVRDRLGSRANLDVLVLCYHAVSPTWEAALSVTPGLLEAQLRMLVRAGWRGTTFHDAVAGPSAGPALAITFDDAYLSVLQLAYPILSELGLPATVFAPTALISDLRRPLSWPGIAAWAQTPHRGELEAMSWSDLRFLAAQGWEIGSHTRTHPRLTQLDDAELSTELEGSRLECASNLGIACDTIAYPYGDVDARVAAAASAAGYTAAAALSSSLRPDGPHRWPRVGIYHGDRMWRFRLKVDRRVRRIRASRLWPAPESIAQG